MILRCVVLAVVLGVLGVGLGACGSSSGVEAIVSTSDQASVSTSDQVTASSRGDDQGAACLVAVDAGEDNAKALCTEAADLGNTDGMYGLGMLAYHIGDSGIGSLLPQKSAGDLELAGAYAYTRMGVSAYEAGDIELAKLWWQEAADFGIQYAIDALAKLNAS